MLITLIILTIVSNAVTSDKRKSIIYSRMVIQGLVLASYISYNNLFIKPLEKGVGLYGGMFNITVFTQGFNLFILIIVSIILTLTAFYPRILRSVSAIYLRSGDAHQTKYLSLNTNLNNKSKGKPNYLQYGYLANKYEFSNVASDLTEHMKIIHAVKLSVIEYALILSFVLCGAILLMSTGDLISMFLSIELQSYGLYILCTLHRDSESATNSGLTYFLLGGMSSCFILLGSAILYINSGTTNLDNIYIISNLSNSLPLSPIGLGIGEGSEILDFTYLSTPYTGMNDVIISDLYKPHYIGISLIFIIVGFLFKVSAAPFHFWSPDVYDGIPTIVTTFVAIIAKVSIFVFLLQLVLNIGFDSGVGNKIFEVKWKDILIISSLLSLVIGSVLGLTQYRIKRLFAYSTISHIGFILLALSVGKIESIQGYIFYVLQYTISNLNAFFILVVIGLTLNFNLQWLKAVNPNYKQADAKDSPVQLISQLQGYFYINPFISLSLSITLFSFVGIPPLIGFFAKQMVLSAALDEGYLFITLVAIITSVIGAVYYLNLVKTMFFYNKSNSEEYKINSDVHVTGDFTGWRLRDGPAIFDYYVYKGNISINNALSVIISILTIVILTFICAPNEWLRVASILSITLFKI